MSFEKASNLIEQAKIDNSSRLNLSSNDLTDKDLIRLIPKIKKIKELTELYLENNHLTNVEFLKEFINLTSLNLTDNQLTNVEFLKELRNLKYLYLVNNNLTELGFLKNLKGLTILSLGGQIIKDFDFLIELKALNRLWLHETNLFDGSFLTQLPNLRDLFIGNNYLTNVSFLKELKHLKTLGIDKNQLKQHSEIIVQLKGVEIFISNNDLSYSRGIPNEIFAELKTGKELVDYYFKTKQGETRELNEIKVLVVGEANSGKSSLIERLVNDNYNPKRNPTEGIIITKTWKVNVNGREVQPNVWDFGGQEIMHATHQFFLTKRSLYILLLDSTVDEEANRISYWLEKIKILGGQSPVIIVKNKVDLKSLALNQKGLTDAYPNIKGFFDVSCEKGDGIETVKQNLIEEIGKVEGIHDQLQKSWFDVKEALECKDEDYISYQTYQEICKAKGVDKEDEEKLIGTLHNLGIVLNFRKDDLVRDETNVLNPQWVTEGVYKIINSRKLFESKGVLNLKMLDEILAGDKYPHEKQKFIVKMMEKFELCFEIPDEKDQYLIPDLLSKEELNTGDWKDSLNFEFHYNIFFYSIFSRLMVKMHKSISKKTYWKTGMVLEYKVANEIVNNALVEVKKTTSKNDKIVISIRGKENTRRDFLSQIRGKLNEVHSSFPREFDSNFEERVSLPGHPEVSVSYKYLIDLANHAEKYVTPEGLLEKFSVAKLLDGVDVTQQYGLDITTKEQQIVGLEKELEPLKIVKENCDDRAKIVGKRKAHLLLGGVGTLIVSILSISIYYGFTLIGVIISAVLFFIPSIVSNIRGKEWSFGKSSEQFIEFEKQKNYQMANFNDKEYDSKIQKLSHLKSEIKLLKE